LATTPGTVAETAVYDTELAGLTRLHRGKVRDLYALDDDHMLIVATDRLSAFDVVLPDPIPGKGRVLNEISLFWFARTAHIIAQSPDRPAAELRDHRCRQLQAAGGPRGDREGACGRCRSKRWCAAT
jgi:phosphoribosylaminoimidazole-succinocarboxamide synthase